MVKIHRIKIQDDYYKDIDSPKLFEIRYNDRGYEVGDIIQFLTLDGVPRSEMLYVITYVLKDFEGLKDGWVCFAFESVFDPESFSRNADFACQILKNSKE